jgi:hypothetical protein
LFGEQFRKQLSSGNNAGFSGALESSSKNKRRDGMLPLFSKNGNKQRGLIELRKAFNLEPYELDLYPEHCAQEWASDKASEETEESAQGRVGEHPITGNTIATFNLLIKVKRKVKKTASDGETDGMMDVEGDEEKFEASLVGLVSKTCRFRSLADFQVEMPKNDEIATLLADMKNLDSMLLNSLLCISNL